MINIIDLRERSRALTFVVTIALIVWSLGLPALMSFANAAALTETEDVLSDSRPYVVSNHTITLKTTTATTASSTIAVDFDHNDQTDDEDFGFAPWSGSTTPSAINFDIATSSTLTGTYTDLTLKDKFACTGAAGQTQYQITSITSETITFNHCSGTDVIAAGTYIQIQIGTNATSGATGDTQVLNGSSSTTPVKYLNVSVATDNGPAAVAIVDGVTVSGAVLPTLSFTVNPFGIDQVNVDGTAGETTDVASTATTLPFGTIPVNTNRTLAQGILVATNANNGFSVTVKATDAFDSTSQGTGTDIDEYADGSGAGMASTTDAAAFMAPTASITDEKTWGHWGVTSSDTSLSTASGFYSEDANPFDGAVDYLAVGTSTPIQIAYHGGPSQTTTAHQGSSTVAYTARISALQEAAGDYATTLVYVVTPRF